jgi:hypothetical protein
MGDEDSGRTSTALSVQHPSGQTVCASKLADMMRRVPDVFTPEECGQLVAAIATAVEDPDLIAPVFWLEFSDVRYLPVSSL